MSGKDETRPGPDLLASLPGEARASDAALLEAVRAMREAVRSDIAALRDEVAALRRAAEEGRPEPAREDLDLWGGRLEDRVDSVRPPAGAGAAVAADRVEAALQQLGDRVAAMFGGLEARLGQTSPLAEDGAAEKIGTALNTMSTMKYDTNQVRTELVRLRRSIDGLHLRGRAFLAPWFAFVFLLGMALESRAHLLYRWLWAN